MSDNAYPITTSQDAEAVATIRRLLPVKINITNSRFCQRQIQQDANDTRIVVHHKYPGLVEAFLNHKRTHGTAIEKALYGTPQSWTWQQQVTRLVEKRPLVFMGRGDFTMLRDGREIGSLDHEWDRVGTGAEVTSEHLTLDAYLSYDEMMLGSLLGVSGPSYFINEGDRYNMAKPGKQGTFEERGIIIGLVGARFEREDRMDSVFIEPSVAAPRQHMDLTTIFREFFGTKASEPKSFCLNTYKARIRISIDLLLLEANERSKAAGKKAYVHIVGLGLGVWQADYRQPETYLEGFMDALDEFGHKMENIGTLDFSYIGVAAPTMNKIKSLAAAHGIDSVFSHRNPADRLPTSKADELLVVSFAWDSNSFPGNEFWVEMLSASGDPAAASMSTIGELHNPILNPQFLGKIHELGP